MDNLTRKMEGNRMREESQHGKLIGIYLPYLREGGNLYKNTLHRARQIFFQHRKKPGP